MRLDAMKYLDGRPLRRNQIVPATGSMTRGIKPQDACRQRIASAEVIEQPPVEPGHVKSVLNGWNVFRHGRGSFSITHRESPCHLEKLISCDLLSAFWAMAISSFLIKHVCVLNSLN